MLSTNSLCKSYPGPSPVGSGPWDLTCDSGPMVNKFFWIDQWKRSIIGWDNCKELILARPIVKKCIILAGPMVSRYFSKDQ